MNKNRLLLSWYGARTKTNYFVGVLDKTANGYEFCYIGKIVKEAEKEGFLPFIGLSDLSKVYKGEKLFSVFERRLPHKSRAIFQRVIRENGLEDSNDQDWEYLRLSKGILATDSLSFLEPVYVQDKTLYFITEVAGWSSYYKEENRRFAEKDELQLRCEESNSRDPQAVVVVDPCNNDRRVGYIRKPFNQVFHKLLTNGYDIQASVLKTDMENGKPTLYIVTGEVDKQLLEDENLFYLCYPVS